MGATSPERYAVVSCHVERPLDDEVWSRFFALQRARPGGFAIAALLLAIAWIENWLTRRTSQRLTVPPPASQ
jgi:hypothetical protein